MRLALRTFLRGVEALAERSGFRRESEMTAPVRLDANEMEGGRGSEDVDRDKIESVGGGASALGVETYGVERSVCDVREEEKIGMVVVAFWWTSLWRLLWQNWGANGNGQGG